MHSRVLFTVSNFSDVLRRRKLDEQEIESPFSASRDFERCWNFLSFFELTESESRSCDEKPVRTFFVHVSFKACQLETITAERT